MKNLLYIHESINAKAGLTATDAYGNPIALKPVEANKLAKEDVASPMYIENEVSYICYFIGVERQATKQERKTVEHNYRAQSYYNTFSNESYGR